MIVDDALLLAYVDGTLSADSVRQVEAASRNDAEIATRIAQLKASGRDFQRAFTQQQLPPIPTTLLESVQRMSTNASLGADVEARAASRQARKETHWWSVWSKPIGAFAAGALCCGLLIYIVGAPDGRDALSPSSALQSSTPLTVAATPLPVARWIKAAAGYQQLFGRETVVDSVVDHASLTRTINAIHNEDKLALHVPDLSAAGLTLKGVHRLRYHGEALIQIVYLPTIGAPVALCVMKESQPPSQGTATQTRVVVEDMDVLTWRHADLRYALIAFPGSTDLVALAKNVESKSAT